MKYLKHYWIDMDGNPCTTNNPIEKRHPEAEVAGLGVKMWLHDSDGIDVCLATAPDTTTIPATTYDGKPAIKELTETQYNSVLTPYNEANTLDLQANEAEREGDTDTAAAKRTAAAAKQAEVQTALDAL